MPFNEGGEKESTPKSYFVFFLKSLSLKTCASKPYKFAFSLQSSWGKPAFTQVWDKKVSTSQSYSMATCGNKRPERLPRLAMRPWTPSRIWSGSIGLGGVQTDISISIWESSFARTGGKRGSCKAALTEASWTASAK